MVVEVHDCADLRCARTEAANKHLPRPAEGAGLLMQMPNLHCPARGVRTCESASAAPHAPGTLAGTLCAIAACNARATDGALFGLTLPAIAMQLLADRARRSLQNLGDLPDAAMPLLHAHHNTSLLSTQLLICLCHATPLGLGCCTWSLNLLRRIFWGRGRGTTSGEHMPEAHPGACTVEP